MDSSGFCLPDDTPELPSSVPFDSTASAAKPMVAQDSLHVPASPATQSKLEMEVSDGRLRIVAEHVSLRDVLKAISATTGAEVQFPTGSLQDQVFVHLGFGTPQEVVRELLKGSHFNYLILASNSDPGGITRLILTKAAAGSNGGPSMASTTFHDSAAPGLYGEGFGAADSASAVPVPTEPANAQAAPPLPSWVHHDGAILSGEALDQMQKSQIQQEQQQFNEELQQKRQQEQNQANQNPPQL